jgi:hypothetical protein
VTRAVIAQARVVRARAGDDGRLARALGDGELDEPQVLLIGQRRRLARRRGDDDAVGAVRADVVQEVDERGLVEGEIVVEGRDDGREDRAQLGHARIIPDGLDREGAEATRAGASRCA